MSETRDTRLSRYNVREVGERWSDEESEEAGEEREEKRTDQRRARVRLRCSEGQWSWRTVENDRVGKDPTE